MAELKSTIINGKLKVNGDEDITSGTLKVGKVSALSSAGGSTYTTGTSGQVLNRMEAETRIGRTNPEASPASTAKPAPSAFPRQT